jgi:CheY-like chemotaxis protein
LQSTANRRRVLLVDDNADAVETLADLLRSSDHEVLVTLDGPAALAQAAAFSPEVALLDIGLPVMDGYELARKLRTLLPKPIRLVAITGYGQEHDRQRCLDAGFAEHLVKPVEWRQVLAAVEHEDASALSSVTVHA